MLVTLHLLLNKIFCYETFLKGVMISQFISQSFYFLFRDEKKQEKLWKYSIECLKGFIDENILSEFGLTVTSLEDKKLSAD